MTTAHRPTFVPRKGNNIYTDIPTLQFSVKDLPANTTLKLRFNEKDGRYYNEDDFLRPKNKEEERKRMIKELKKREREEKNYYLYFENTGGNQDIGDLNGLQTYQGYTFYFKKGKK